MFVSLPTGFGKFLCYALLLLVFARLQGSKEGSICELSFRCFTDLPRVLQVISAHHVPTCKLLSSFTISTFSAHTQVVLTAT